jgi:hypothetical protein
MLEQFLLGVHDLDVSFRDQDTDRRIGPAVYDQVIESGPFNHVGKKAAAA